MQHIATAEWRIEPIDEQCERSLFSCGEPALDDFLKTKARKFHEQNISATFVALPTGSRVIHGFYTLAQISIAFEELPAEWTKRLPRNPLPALLIGRFAVDTTCQKRGLGKLMLVDALRTAMEVASGVGVFAVALDAKNDHVRAFYEHFGFRSLPGAPLRMFMGMAAIRKQFADASSREDKGHG